MWKTSDTMTVVGNVLKTAFNQYGIKLTEGMHPITVDMDGLGKGVGDRLREQGCLVLEYRGNAVSEVDPKTYKNLRAEGYGELGNRLNPQGPFPDEPFGLPDHHMLHEELVAPQKIYTSDGFSYHITPKKAPNDRYKGDTLIKLLGRSPDYGDSAVMRYHAIRYWVKCKTWGESWEGDLIASGEDVVAEHAKFDQEELETLLGR